jgi:hypothetical protein
LERESGQRQEAEAQREAARAAGASARAEADRANRLLYVARLHLAEQAWENTNVDGRQYRWQTYQAKGYVLDLTRFLSRERSVHSVAYAVCYLVADAGQEQLQLKVSSDDQAKVYLNGREIYRHTQPRAMLRDEHTVAPVALRRGTNVLVFKLVNEEYFWEGCLRFLDREGNPVPNFQVRLTP